MSGDNIISCAYFALLCGALLLAGCAKKPVKSSLVIPAPSPQCPRTETLRSDFVLKSPCQQVSDSLALCPIKDATLEVHFSCVKVKQQPLPTQSFGSMPGEIRPESEWPK